MSDHSSSRVPGTSAPSTESWETLIKRWQYERLTVEQAIGQLLLWGQHLHRESTQMQRLQVQLERQIATLAAEQDARPPA